MKGRHVRQAPRRHRLPKYLMVLASVGVGVGVASAAWSFFSPRASAPGAAQVDTLNPPTNVLVSFPNVGQRTVLVSWAAPSEPAGITLDGYYVQRVLGGAVSPACGTSPSALVSTLTCNDTGVASNTYTYAVTAVFRTWTASALSDSVIVPAPRLTAFDVSPSLGDPTAGVPFGVVVTAEDQYGDVDTGFGGSQCVAFSGPLVAPNATPPNYSTSSPCTNATPVRFNAGVSSTTNITLFDAASATLSASEVGTPITGSTTLVTGPGAISALALDPSTNTPVAGTAFDVGATAYDRYGNVDTNYTGNQCVVFSGPASAPGGQSAIYQGPGVCASGSDVNFTNGTTTGAGASVTVFDAVDTTLNARDLSSGVTGTTDLTTGPSDLASLALDPSTNTPVAGTAFNVGVTAYDQYGNVDTNDAGTQCVLFAGAANAPSGKAPSYPDASGCASGSSVNFIAGVASGPGASVTLYDAPSTPTTLTATDVVSSAHGSTNLAVGPAAINYLTLSPSDSTPVAGTNVNVGVSAYDQYGNVDSNYTGNQCLLFSGSPASPGGQFPTYPAADGCASGSTVAFSDGTTTGIGAVVNLVSAGATNLSATDVTSGQSGSTGMVVGAAPVSDFSLTPTNTTPNAGQSFNLTIAADDQYGNVNQNYTGGHCLTFSGAANAPDGTAPIYPDQGGCGSNESSVTFVNGVANGVGVTLYRARSTTLAVTETSSGLTDTSVVNVGTDSATGLELTAITVDAVPPLSCSGVVGSRVCVSSDPGNTAGEAVGASIRLVDEYGNTTTNATGAALAVDFAVSGSGSVTPIGDGALSIPSGQSTTTGAFVLSLDTGSGNGVTMVATLDGTSETLTITLSS